MKIEKIRPEHLCGIAELERLCFSSPWSECGLAVLTRPEDGGVGFCATDEDGIPLSYVGMIRALDEGEIMNVATHPNARGKGLAKAVITALKDHCQAEGVRMIFLEVRESNEAAIGLYTSLGFYEVGRRPNFYKNPRETAITMRLDIDSEVIK